MFCSGVAASQQFNVFLMVNTCCGRNWEAVLSVVEQPVTQAFDGDVRMALAPFSVMLVCVCAIFDKPETARQRTHPLLADMAHI